MTPVLLLSLYFIALTAFLGVDIIAKVPVTMYASVIAVLGAVGGVVVVGAIYLRAGTAGVDLPDAREWLGTAGVFAGAAAAGAAVAAMGRLLPSFARRRREG